MSSNSNDHRSLGTCECPAFNGEKRIFCERHGVKKSKHWVHLCKTREDYFRAWEEGRGPGQDIPEQYRRKAKLNHIHQGAGTELARLLKRFGIREKAKCMCKSHAAMMDRMGTSWCRSHRKEIVAWMKTEASKRGLPFFSLAAHAILQMAILRAEQDIPIDKT